MDATTITRTLLDAPVSAEGRDWYPQMHATLAGIADAHGIAVENVIIATALLSPRLRWTQNVAAVAALAAGLGRPAGIMSGPWDRAAAAIVSDDPWSAFSPRARKTHAFARALMLDPDAVVIDVWAWRVAGQNGDGPKNVSEYVAVADAYRAAAALRGMRPAEFQAASWVAATHTRPDGAVIRPSNLN